MTGLDLTEQRARDDQITFSDETIKKAKAAGTLSLALCLALPSLTLLPLAPLPFALLPLPLLHHIRMPLALTCMPLALTRMPLALLNRLILTLARLCLLRLTMLASRCWPPHAVCITLLLAAGDLDWVAKGAVTSPTSQGRCATCQVATPVITVPCCKCLNVYVSRLLLYCLLGYYISLLLSGWLAACVSLCRCGLAVFRSLTLCVSLAV